MSGSQVTPFLRLLKPPFDAVPWDEAINGNMDTIDAFIARYMAVPNYVGAWANSVQYISGQNVLDITDATIYQCLITHTSSAIPATFASDRATYPTYWAATQNVVTGGTGNTNLTISSATPFSAKAGDLWWDSVGGQLYILYNDGNSLQWVIANNQAGNVGEAPNDGNTYGRRNSAWTQVSTGNVGRNLIHNSLFNVAQRGAGPFTTTGNTLDRWIATAVHSNGSASIVQTALADAARTVIGDEAAVASLQYAFTGGTGAGDYDVISQRIEDVRRPAGKTVIASFWAVASVGTPKIGVGIFQSFGNGGSPSASVTVNAVQVVLTSTWTRYSVTLAIPSAIGKTLGTNNNSFTELDFYLSSGATNNAAAGGIGVQNGTVFLWGVQLEIGNTATPLEKPDPQQDLAKCQRFYEIGQAWGFGYGAAAASFGNQYSFKVTKRALPTIVLVNQASSNCGATSVLNLATVDAYSATRSVVGGTVAASYSDTFTASADL